MPKQAESVSEAAFIVGQSEGLPMSTPTSPRRPRSCTSVAHHNVDGTLPGTSNAEAGVQAEYPGRVIFGSPSSAPPASRGSASCSEILRRQRAWGCGAVRLLASSRSAGSARPVAFGDHVASRRGDRTPTVFRGRGPGFLLCRRRREPSSTSPMAIGQRRHRHRQLQRLQDAARTCRWSCPRSTADVLDESRCPRRSSPTPTARRSSP